MGGPFSAKRKVSTEPGQLQYVLWGLPYAALDKRILRGFLIALPTVTTLIEPFYANTYLNTATNVAIVAYFTFELLRSNGFRRSSRE
jgi:hypothetical protein